MDFLGNNAGDFVEEDRGAVFNHISGEWLDGRELIEIDGGNRDLVISGLLAAVIVLFSWRSLKIAAVAVFLLGVVYWRIRDDVDRYFPDILLQ